jgi:cytochrome d ubiquinol oxidase subunit II
MILDYETLKLIWWALIGLLLIGFALTDGFDMGVGALLMFIGKTNEDRRVMINTVGPHWEGNQTWLVTAIGALFAAWPLVYAMAFSGFYLLMMITLFALFLRPLAFDYRSKIDNTFWRSMWDKGLFIGSTVPPLMFGLAFGNLLQGVPFYFDEVMRVYYTGSFIDLVNPFALLTALISLTMIIMHGAVWLQMRTLDSIEYRSRLVAKVSAIILPVLFAIAGVWVYAAIDGFVITSMPGGTESFIPQAKQVSHQAGAWLINFQNYPWLTLIPFSVFFGVTVVYFCADNDQAGWAFIGSSIALVGIILTAGVSMFPFIVPSSSIANHSLTIWDATSSLLTLKIMFWIAMIVVPIIIGYSFWTYRKMWRRLDSHFILSNQHSTY